MPKQEGEGKKKTIQFQKLSHNKKNQATTTKKTKGYRLLMSIETPNVKLPP